MPYALFPEPGGLLVWGVTDNGDEFYWLTEGAPDDWTVVVSSRHEWWSYDGGALSLLGGLLRREIHCPGLPDEFPEPGYQVRAE